MIDHVIAWLQLADPALVYLILFLSAFFENIVPPIPGDITVAFGGYLLAFSRISFFWALFWTTAGSVGGFMTVFLLVRALGARLYGPSAAATGRFAQWVLRMFPPDEMDAVRMKYSRHGYVAVLINRFLLGSRALISVVSGLLHLNVFSVFLASLTSAALWNCLLLYGGYVLGRNWEGIGAYLAIYSVPVTVLFAGYLLWSVGRQVARRKQRD